jgi:hypothetical protein
MNERIEELAVESGLYVDLNGTSWPRAMSAEESEAAYKKFAELIIRDTSKLLRQEWYDLNNAPPVEGESDRDVGIRVGGKSEVIVLMNKIYQHFGVE